MKCYLSVSSYMISAQASGVALGAYPTANRLTTFSYNQNLAIIGMQLSSTYDVQTAPVGVAVVIGTTPLTLDITGSPNIYMIQVAQVNDDTVTVTGIGLSDFISFNGAGISLPNGSLVGIYGWGAGSANNVLAASLCIHTVLAK